MIFEEHNANMQAPGNALLAPGSIRRRGAPAYVSGSGITTSRRCRDVHRTEGVAAPCALHCSAFSPISAHSSSARQPRTAQEEAAAPASGGRTKRRRRDLVKAAKSVSLPARKSPHQRRYVCWPPAQAARRGWLPLISTGATPMPSQRCPRAAARSWSPLIAQQEPGVTLRQRCAGSGLPAVGGAPLELASAMSPGNHTVELSAAHAPAQVTYQLITSVHLLASCSRLSKRVHSSAPAARWPAAARDVAARRCNRGADATIPRRPGCP